jgi:hypothetical protein
MHTKVFRRIDVLIEATEACAAEWNAKVPAGTPVRYFPVLGQPESVVSKTRSPAWLTSCDQVVCLIIGHPCPVSLDHLRVELAKAA